MSRNVARAALVSAFLAALCIVGAVVAAHSAGAPGDQGPQVSVSGKQFTGNPTQGLFDVSGIVPGGGSDALLGVRAGSAGASKVVLRLIAVHDDENGCRPAERRTDRSCGTGAGELGDALVFTVSTASTSAGTYRQVWRGTVAQFKRGADTDTVLAPRADSWVRVRAMLPTGTGNEVQSDGFRFGLRVDVVDGLGTEGVSVGTGSGGAHSGATSGVSATGLPLALLLAGAGLLVACGALLAGSARRRPARGADAASSRT